ncbi:unnamed protein product [Mytilus coruscus]|uniref:Uncharacterized protein n=1 Tax=Mytilus coruscus TaxID=42192 RepID=A0A6J8EG33_MYTCO|nr:unnamed protein product [Mytilus coruscus]
MIVKTAFILFGLLSYVKTWELRPPGYPAITYKGHTNSPITGHTVQLECSSAGGMPTPNITWYVDERRLTNSANITVSPVTTTGDVTSSILTISHVTIGEHLQVFKCKVDNGVLQSDLVATFYIVAPPAPTLSGKTTVLAGDVETWFCSSTAGFLEPKMTMYLNNVPIQSGFTVDKSSGGVIGTLIWTAQSMNDGDQLTCKIEHDLFDPKSTSLMVTVQATPLHPIFTGPTVFTPGQQRQWTCESNGGNPAPSMTITINNNQIYSGITSYEVKDTITKTTDMTTTLNWAPSIANDGDSLCCKVTHVTLSYTQSSCLILQLAQATNNFWVPQQLFLVSKRHTIRWILIMTMGVVFLTRNKTQRWTVTQNVIMTPTALNDGQKICCEVPTLQPACLTLAVQVATQPPTISGTSTIILGQQTQWSCTTLGGYQKPNMIMTMGGFAITSGISNQETQDPITQRWTVTQNVIMTPTALNDGQKICCEVPTLQPSCLTLAVQDRKRRNLTDWPQTQWTCTTIDGYPKPNMIMTMGGVPITNGFYNQETQNPITQMWTVTQNVIMTPTTLNDGQKICCEVSTLQPVCLTLAVQVSLQPATISGPTVVISGQQTQWTCTTIDGYPKPNMIMTMGGVQITNGFYRQETQDPITQTWTVTQNVIMTPTTLNDGQKICCEVQTLQPVCRTLAVQVSLQPPTISGPSTVVIGQQTQWTCTSLDGYPKPNMVMTLGGYTITNGFTNQETQNPITNMWTVTQNVVMTPTALNDGQKICCQVPTLQPVCRTLAVQVSLQPPTISGPSTVLIGQQTQWTCTSLDGYPKPNMVMTLGGYTITNGFTNQETQKSYHEYVDISLQPPTISGPSTVVIGQQTQWTCTSLDGYPKPNMVMTLGGYTITNGFTNQETQNPITNMWTVTQNVVMTPTALNDGQKICCQVSTLQPVCRTLAVQVSLQPPTISGPSTVIIGQQTQWTCTSLDGYPKPNMVMTLGGYTITNGFTNQETQNPITNMWTITQNVVMTPTTLNDGQKICCEVPTLQPVCRTLAVQVSLQPSTISGPTIVIPGQQTQWTCTSLDGYPKPNMFMTIGGVTITNGFYSQETQNPITQTWTVTQNVIMTPTTLNNGQKICCEVPTLQPVCLTLTVQVAPQPPTISGPPTVITGQQSQWTCTSLGGYPKPNMIMKLNGVTIISGIYTQETQDPGLKTWTVSQTVTMTPTALNNGQSICCEVYHAALTTTQSTCRTIVVQGTDSLCQGPATVVFALDGSDSISNDNYQTMITFTINNINSFNLGQNYIMVGALVYGSDVTAINPMSDKANLIQEIQSKLIQPRDGTRTDKALETIRSQMVNLPITRSRVAIFITDGESYDKVQTEIQANLAKQQGILIAAFGIDMKPGTDGFNELNTIASSPDLVFLFDSFNSLITNITMIKDILCQVITPTTTTTTTAPLTTTLKTDPIVTDPLCEGCVIVDGHAYVAHDSDCSKFYHCYLTHDTNGDEIMVAKEENCAAKTFWSQEHKTCVTWENMVCPNPLNKCFGQGDGTLMPYLGCETYWMCQGGIPLPMACSNNRIFDANTLQCIPDPGTTNCFGPTLQTCNFEEDPSDSSKYFVKQQAQDGSIIMIHQTCAAGTLYDQSKCSCSTHDTNIVILPSGCQVLVEQGQNGVFTFKQTSDLIYGINSNALVDFQTDPDAMKLTPDGHIIMYRLANYDFQQAFAVSFKLQLSASSQSGLQQILINCIYPDTATALIDTPSISIQVGKSPTGDYTFFSQLQTTDGMQIINVSITSSTSAYVDVTMAYDGNVFVLNVDGQESSIALTGSILKGPTFALGRPLTKPTTNGIQYLDAKDIRLYSTGDQGQAECNVTEAIKIQHVGKFIESYDIVYLLITSINIFDGKDTMMH